MSTLPTAAAPSTGVELTSIEGARFALSIRERRAVLAIADLVVAAIACTVAFLLHPGHIRTLPLFEISGFGAIWLIALLVTDGYAFEIPSSRLQSSVAVLKALPVALLLAVFAFFLRPYALNRTIIVLALIIGAVLLIVMRITAARLLLHESLAVRAVLLADVEPSQDVRATLDAARFECRVAATVIGRAATQEEASRVLEDVAQALKRCHAQELIVTNSELRLLPGLAEECLNQGVRVVAASELVERYMGRVPIESIDVHWYLGLPDNDLLERPYAVARRVADLLLSFVLSLPFLVLLPLLALAIRLDSHGPVFLVQRRLGEHGQAFNLLKLRTMSSDAESSGPRLAAPSDPRVTRVGRFLRATRLDEFPQLLNIVRGDMSFIGPRPERPEFMSVFEGQVPHFRSRLLVKPGLTGWAQVRAGYASTVADTTRKLEYDLYYIKNRSFRLDLQILAGTFVTVLGRRGR